MSSLKGFLKNNSYADLVSSLLNFNPYFRMTAWECLRHPAFDSIRDPKREGLLQRMNDKCQILLPVDMDDAFDYDNASNAKYTRPELIRIL